MEFTGQQGINVLKMRHKIYEQVCNGGYEEAIEEYIKGIKETWLDLSTELLPFTEACNDQSKQDDTKHETLKKHIAEYLKLWSPYINTKNPIYHKLPSSMCCLFFHRKYGMLGQVNAQGFEDKHFEMRLIKLLTGKIARRAL